MVQVALWLKTSLLLSLLQLEASTWQLEMYASWTRIMDTQVA
jgi:hypothetical protein